MSQDTTGKELANPKMYSPKTFIDYIKDDTNLPSRGASKKTFGGGAVYVMLDLPNWWPSAQSGSCSMSDGEVSTVRALRDIINDIKGKQIFIVSREAFVPPDLKNIVTVLDWPLPNFSTIRNKVQVLSGSLDKRRKTVKLPPITIGDDDLDLIARTFQGLSIEEIESIFRQTAVRNQDFDVQTFIDSILDAKTELIRKANVGLEIVDTSDLDMNSVGGLKFLKDFVTRRSGSFGEKARKFGLPAPKGLLLIGVQGCGKSLTAKVIGREWNLPVLRLDVGAMFEGLVGASESNTRRALQVAEAMSPCVLWIDEIDKSLSGVSSSDQSDAGTTARVFQTILTWMQEKKSAVYVAGTANRVISFPDGNPILPPEMLRKGRFDEIFFVDLPDIDERKQIIRIHISKHRHPEAPVRNPDDFDIDALAKASHGYSGAEIEAAINEGLNTAFYEGQRELRTEDILTAMKETLPLSVTMGPSIEMLRAWASKHTRPASKPFDISPDMEEKRRAVKLESGWSEEMDDLEIDDGVGEGPDLD